MVANHCWHSPPVGFRLSGAEGISTELVPFRIHTWCSIESPVLQAHTPLVGIVPPGPGCVSCRCSWRLLSGRAGLKPGSISNQQGKEDKTDEDCTALPMNYTYKKGKIDPPRWQQERGKPLAIFAGFVPVTACVLYISVGDISYSLIQSLFLVLILLDSLVAG